MTLEGRRALITGGSRGIGAATARLLAVLGASVVVAYRSRAQDADRLTAEIRAKGGHAFAFAADLSSPDATEELFAAARASLGGLDLVIANAGTWPPEEVDLGTLSFARWRDTMRHNIDATFLTCRAAARDLTANGRLVLLSSTAGQRGEALHADYATAKGGIIALVKSLAIELAARGITVNAVAPGWVDTEMIEPATVAGGRERIERAIPLGRMATAEDIAGPIAFLCSDLARHITGEVLNVNGGSVLCG